VVEALSIPPGLDFLALDVSLIIMVSAGVDDGPDHTVHLVVHDEIGREVAPAVAGSILGGSAVPGYPFYCSFAFTL
jgi:hypothetical protein